MSEQQQRETHIVINDTSQGCVATCFMCGETFDHYFIRPKNLLPSLLWKNF